MMKLITDNIEIEVSPDSCVYFEDKTTGNTVYVSLKLDNKTLQEIHHDNNDQIKEMEGIKSICEKVFSDCLRLLSTLDKS